MKKVFNYTFSVFCICVFSLFIYISFSLAQNDSNSGQTDAEKLGFPYSINFTPAEIKYLKKLPPETLQKLINVAKMTASQSQKQNSQTQNTTGGLLGGQNPGTGAQQQNPYQNPQQSQQQNPFLSPSAQSQSNPFLGTPSTGSSGQSQGQSGGQQGNQQSPGAAPTTGDTSKECGSGEASDGEFRQMLSASGIKVAGASGFGGEIRDGVLMLKELETDCNCKVIITSGVRAGRPRGTAHGPGTRSFDLGYSTEILNLLKSKGQTGNNCWYTYKGIKFLDEQRCPSAGATGPHWHVEGNGWQCSKK